MGDLKSNQSFNVDDIRRIRDEDYERRKNMTPAERAEDIRKGAEEGYRILAEIRAKKNAK